MAIFFPEPPCEQESHYNVALARRKGNTSDEDRTR
jgi:hypothetical protein